jgi:hypothetical protein
VPPNSTASRVRENILARVAQNRVFGLWGGNFPKNIVPAAAGTSGAAGSYGRPARPVKKRRDFALTATALGCKVFMERNRKS